MPQYQINVPGQGSFRVNSPTDLTEEQVWAAVQGQLAAPAAPPTTSRTWGESAKDIGASVVGGLGSLLQAPGQLTQLVPGLQGLGQALAKPGEVLEEAGESLKSQGLKVREQLRSQKISEAEKEGILSSFGTAIAETVKDPALLSTFITGQLPQLLGPMAAAKVGKVVVAARSGLAGEALEAAAGKTATRAAVGTGAAMQGADISADAYKQALEIAQSQGLSEDQANEAALTAARKAFALATPISVASQMLPGAKAIERRLAGVAGEGRIKSAIGEAVSEAIEEGGGAFATNVGVLGVDPTRALTQGVGSAAGLGTLGGGVLGGVLGAAPKPQLQDGMLPGETERQAAERLQAEIFALRQAQEPPAPPPPGPVLDTKNLYNLMAQPNGYALVEQYKQRLLALPEQTEEIKQALEDASFIQRRSVIEGMSRQPTKAVLDERRLKQLGFRPQEDSFQVLLGKDMANPDQAEEINQALTDVKTREETSESEIGKIDNFLVTLNEFQEAIYPRGKDAGTTVAAPSGESVQVVSEPDTGAAAPRPAIPEPTGVVSPVTDVAEPAAGEGQQPTPVEQTEKDKLLNSIAFLNLQNTKANYPSITGLTEDGKISFAGDFRRAPREAKALLNTYEAALKAGATPQEVFDASQSRFKPTTVVEAAAPVAPKIDVEGFLKGPEGETQEQRYTRLVGKQIAFSEAAREGFITPEQNAAYKEELDKSRQWYESTQKERAANLSPESQEALQLADELEKVGKTGIVSGIRLVANRNQVTPQNLEFYRDQLSKAQQAKVEPVTTNYGLDAFFAANQKDKDRLTFVRQNAPKEDVDLLDQANKAMLALAKKAQDLGYGLYDAGAPEAVGKLKSQYSVMAGGVSRLLLSRESTLKNYKKADQVRLNKDRIGVLEDIKTSNSLVAETAPSIPATEVVTVPMTTQGAKEQHAVKGLPIIEAPIEQLTISKDVPQFKSEADERGVVKRLEGKFERTGVAPIQLWRRTDGRLEVISGRHRFDLAQRSGETTIPAQVHDEASGFDAAKAGTLDAELNIRDEQGEVKDYVVYFERSGISEEDAKARGLLGRTVGQRGWAIASQGSPDLIAAHRAGIVPDDAAAGIATIAPKDSRLQAVGLKAVRDNKSTPAVLNTMQAVKALAVERGAPQEEAGDLFGFDDSAIKEAEEMARIATDKQREVSKRLAAIEGAAKNPAVAKAEGIDIKDEAALSKRIQELRQLRAAWSNWSSSPNLVKEIRDQMTKPAEPPAKASLVEMRKRYEAGRTAPVEAPVETKPEPTELDKEIEAKIEQLGKILSRIMGRFGLKDVALKLVEDMKAEGEYAQSVVRLALDAASPAQALRHESIHALKELGFFTPQQWATLEKQAKSKWVDQYLKNVNINKQPLGEGEKSRYDAYMDLYKGDMDAIIEEAIADAFADFDVNKAPPGLMQAILTRLRNFFDAVKTAFGGEVTAEQLFRKVEKGELKAGTVPQINGQFERLSLSLPDDYRGEHKAPTKNSGSPAHDLSGVYPDDVYSPRGPQYYAHYADSRDLESFEIIRRVRNLPNVPLTVYRAVPKSAPSVINTGDWVTISKKYAKEHGEGPLKGDYKIVNKLVHPRDIFTNGDSIHEWGYDPQPRIAGEEAKSLGYKPSLREVPLSTRGLMEVQPIVAMQELGLKTDAVRKPGGIELFNDVRSIALALNQDTIRNKGKIAKTNTSVTSEKELARAMVDEIGYQLRATSDTGTGKGWYSDNYPKAVKKLGKLYPELATDPYARTVFSALVAITSNGEKVSLNVKNAIKLYEDIRMGKDPRDIGSRRQKALDNNIAVVLQLMKQYGPTGMRNELLREITVKDMNAILRSRGEKADTSYLADTKVPAAALYFGPKLGAFFSNLEGAEGYLTMDMWWTRTVNRMRGQLESKATEASIKKFANMMDKPNATREEVVAATIPLRNKYEEFGWHTELEELVGSKEPAEDKDKPAWTAKAKRKAGPAYQALLFEHRLEKMANTIYKNEYELLEEAPFTSSDREFMYRTARRAQSLLKAEGINLSLADIQAALWYYEKRLYQHLSGRKADDIGYDEAITQLAGESSGPARPSVVFGGQPVPGAGPAGAGAAATGTGGKPAKPSLRATSASAAFNQKQIDDLRKPDYKGREKLIEMPINDFLNLADDQTDTQKLTLARQRLNQGKQFTSLPYLNVDLDYRVDGHEGRHRAKALLENGYETMPVILRMAGMRWSEQSDPNRFDYIEDWPKTIQAQAKAQNPNLLLPFPVSREDADKPYTAPLPKFSLRSTTPVDILNRVVLTTVARDEKTFVQRITEAISPTSFASFRAAALNRYNQLGVYDRKLAEQMKQAGGAALLASNSAEAAALLSDVGAGLAASALGVHDRMGGVPVYRNGITIISNKNNTVKGPLAIFVSLAKFGDPFAYQAYQFWAGVKRGSRFLADGREELFEPADIQKAERLRQQFLKDGVDFEAIQKEWIKYNDGLVDYGVATGVLSKERADIYKKHSDYLPFYRQMDGAETVGPKVFQAISGVKPPKKLKGSEAPLDDFLENIVRNTQSMIQMGVKNVAAQRAAEVATKINMVQRLNYQANGPTNFQVYENGKVVSYNSSDILFINAIKSLGLPELPFIGFLSAPANVLRNLVTKDPGFMLANLMRDSMSAWVTSGVKMKPMVDTISNFGSALAGKDPAFQALMNAGILGGYEFSQNVEQSGREFGKALRKQAGVRAPGYKGILEMGAKPFTSLWEALEKGTTASDAATRMEVYKKTLAETGNEAEALYRALEVMNFNRKGSSAVVRILTAAVPFLNARMQGLDVLYRASTGKMNVADAKEIQKRFFVRGATIMALSAAYWALTHDDDEYKKQEQETRDNYWLLPSMGVKIPIPFEIGVLFKVIPERILAYTFGSDTGEDFLKSMGRQLTSTLAFNPIPQTALPVVEAMTNFSFFTMRPIVGQGLEGVQPAYQVGPGTSRLAEKIGAATKGLATELQISPMKLDQLINGYTGTMGMYLVNLMDAVYDMNTDSPKPSMRFERMPVIRRFALDPDARGSVTAYYELKNSVDAIVRTSNMLERTMNYQELPGYLQDNMKMLASKDYLLDLEKTMKEFREMKVMIRSSQMEADAKRDSIKSIDQMENQLTANIQYLKSLAKGG